MSRPLQTVLGVSCSIILFLTTPAHAIVDTNENGVSDLWEKSHNSGELFDETFDPQADPDADGWTNAEEAAAGTDPFDANPPDGLIRPDIAHIPAVYDVPDENGDPVILTPEAVTVTWPTLVGKQYTLLFSADLSTGSWITVGAPFIGNGSEVTCGFEISGSDKRFWRVAATDTDTDGDGLTDSEEHELGTEPALTDTDGDGIPDDVEIATGTKPDEVDSDKDGQSDGDDAVPTDAAICWPKTPVPHYAVVETGIPSDSPSGQVTITDINRSGEILYSTIDWTNPRTDSIWSPATGNLRDASSPANFLGVPITAIDSSAIASDGSHHATLGNHAGAVSTATYQTPAGAWTQYLSGSWAPPDFLTSLLIDVVDTRSLCCFAPQGTDPSYLTYTLDSSTGTWSSGPATVFTWDNSPLSINSQGHILFKDRIERPGTSHLTVPSGAGTAFGSVAIPVAGSTTPRYLDVVLGNGTMHVQPREGNTLIASTHSVLPYGLRIAENGLVLQSHIIWLNGKNQALSRLISAPDWTDVQAAALSTNGLIAATARRRSTGEREIVLLLPMEVRGYATKEVDDSVGYVNHEYVKEKKRKHLPGTSYDDPGDPDDSDDPHFKTEAKTNLKIVQLGDDYVDLGNVLRELFSADHNGNCTFVHKEFKRDLDIFRVRLPDFPLPTGINEHQIKIWTTKKDGTTELDSGAKVNLNIFRSNPADPASTVRFHETPALALVPDDADDDDFKVEGKADGALGDRTYRAVLGGVVKIQWLTVPGQPVIEIPVPAERIVKATGFLLPSACNEAKATPWFERAKKIYSAIGVDLVYTFVELDPIPSGVTLNEFDLPYESGDLTYMMPETKALMDDSRVVKALTMDPNTKGSIPVFFVNRLNPPPGKTAPAAMSNTPSFMAPSDKGYGGAIFMNSKAYESDPTEQPQESVLAHELSHILLDAPHYPSTKALWDSYFTGKKCYIWWGDIYRKDTTPLNPNPWSETDIIAHRRLCDSMRTRIWKSKYAKLPSP